MKLWYQVKLSQLEDDINYLMSLVGLTEQVYDFFSVEEISKETGAHNFFSIASFNIQLDRNEDKISRSSMTFWNVLGEIGGLYGLLFGLFSFIDSMFSYNKAENSLASRLYTE